MRCKAIVSEKAISVRSWWNDDDPHCSRQAVVRGYCRQHARGSKSAPKVYCKGEKIRTVLIGRIPFCPRCRTPLPWLIR